MCRTNGLYDMHYLQAERKYVRQFVASDWNSLTRTAMEAARITMFAQLKIFYDSKFSARDFNIRR
jgi:hypothetical protein